MRLVLLGAPGSGKGTQAKKLVDKYSIPEINMGDILRKAVADGTPLGIDAKVSMDRGELVPDSIVMGMVHARLKKADCGQGFIIDGFPRNLTQAMSLDKMLSTMGLPITAAVSLDVDNNELTKRMTGRRTCRTCGQLFNVYFLPPAKEEVCDKCGGGLVRRGDDHEKTVVKRLEIYNAQTAPLIDYYGKKGILTQVKGTGHVYEIFRKVCEAAEGGKAD